MFGLNMYSFRAPQRSTFKILKLRAFTIALCENMLVSSSALGGHRFSSDVISMRPRRRSRGGGVSFGSLGTPRHRKKPKHGQRCESVDQEGGREGEKQREGERDHNSQCVSPHHVLSQSPSRLCIDSTPQLDSQGSHAAFAMACCRSKVEN